MGDSGKLVVNILLEIVFFVHCGNRKLRGNCMFGLGRSYNKFLLALIIYILDNMIIHLQGVDK